MKQDMTNREFYEQMLEYERQGLIVFMPKILENGFFKIRVGAKIMAISSKIYDFGNAISEKHSQGIFHTQKSLEESLSRSANYIKRLVREQKYEMFIRGKGLKFYIKRDW